MSGSASQGVERRRVRRAAVSLRGRFLLADGGEHPCETVDASVKGLALRAYVTPRLGEKIVLYLDELGRLEGQMIGRRPDGFLLELTSPSVRTEKLAQKLADISGAGDAFSFADPAAVRRRRAELRVEFGQTYQVRVGDETSMTARIFADLSLLPGARVFLDERPATVLHDNESGFVIGFER